MLKKWIYTFVAEFRIHYFGGYTYFMIDNAKRGDYK